MIDKITEKYINESSKIKFDTKEKKILIDAIDTTWNAVGHDAMAMSDDNEELAEVVLDATRMETYNERNKKALEVIKKFRKLDFYSQKKWLLKYYGNLA